MSKAILSKSTMFSLTHWLGNEFKEAFILAVQLFVITQTFVIVFWLTLNHTHNFQQSMYIAFALELSIFAWFEIKESGIANQLLRKVVKQ